MTRPPVAALAIAGVGLCLWPMAYQPRAQAAAPSPPNAASKIDDKVVAALARSSPVRVNVTLSGRAPFSPTPRGRSEFVRDNRAVEDGVLASLDASEYQLVYRLDGVAALTLVTSPMGIQHLASHPDVTAITLDEIGAGAGYVGAQPEMSSSRDAYSLSLINADKVQALGITGAGVTVAVLDSGVDTSHPDLADSITVQECFLSAGGCPGGGTRASGPGAAEDDNGHGTNVTGIITGNGTIAPIGVAPAAQIAAYKVLNASNLGYFSDFDAALSDIIANHPEVRAVNMSLVSFTTYSGPCDTLDPTTTNALSTLRAAGAITFVSSGNNQAKTAITYPACISNAVAVGAVYNQTFSTSTFFGCTDTPASQDQVTCWSNSDAQLALLAPGAFITSTGLNNGTSVYGGTSQAAPHAAGVAALMMQAMPGITPDLIQSRLKATGVPRTDAANGRVTPRIDALAAIYGSSVGGIAEAPDVAALPAAATSSGHDITPFAVGAAVVAIVLTAGSGWQLRGRRSG